MIRRGISLGRVLGIDVSADPTVLLIGALLAWSFASGLLPDAVPGHVGATYWSVGILGALIFLLSLLGHELSHSVVARRNGVGVEGITLWLFGGVARLEGQPKGPGAEFRIAAAGPAMSILIGVVLGGAAFGLRAVGGPDVWVAMLYWLGFINVFLAVFNLLPGAPLDGGRILGSVLWKIRGNRSAGLAGAAKVGTVIGGLLVAAGVAEMWFTRSIAGIWTIMIGFFLFNAARAEAGYYEAERALGGLTVAGAMLSPVQVTSTWATVLSAVQGPFAHTSQTALPVVDAAGQVRGLLPMSVVQRTPADQWASIQVADVMVPVEDVVMVEPTEPMTSVIARAGTADHVLVLSDRDLVGMVGPAEVRRTLQLMAVGSRSPRSAPGDSPPPPPSGAPPQEWHPPVHH